MPQDPGLVLSPRSVRVSPSELLMKFINDNADGDVLPAGSVVGPADDDMQQQGVISLMDAGDTKREDYAPLLWKRVQVRCMGPSLEKCDDIGQWAFELLNDQRWLELADERGRVWFVHLITVTVGPSHHFDSTETWESLMFANVTVGRDPVLVPDPSGF